MSWRTSFLSESHYLASNLLSETYVSVRRGDRSNPLRVWSYYYYLPTHSVRMNGREIKDVKQKVLVTFRLILGLQVQNNGWGGGVVLVGGWVSFESLYVSYE